MNYQPNPEDVRFVLHAVLDATPQLRALAPFAEIDEDLQIQVLDEAAKFVAEVVAPVNRAGDEIGCRLVDGEVITPPGFREAYAGFQQGGWPAKGYEVQVNNSHTDWRRTGSLYGIQDVKEVYVKDNEWYTEYIKVEGKRVIIKLNDKTVVDYTEPANLKREGGDSLRIISNGTFALQGHDPKSKVYFKNLMVKILPE